MPAVLIRKVSLLKGHLGMPVQEGRARLKLPASAFVTVSPCRMDRQFCP